MTTAPLTAENGTMNDTFTNPIITAQTLIDEYRGKYWYLATPYTHADFQVMCRRAEEAMRVAGQLMQKGLVVYSPIWHCHEIARTYSLPTDFKFWDNFNTTMIRPAAGIIVATMKGWEESKGVTDEIHKASMMDKPVYYYDPVSDTFSD